VISRSEPRNGNLADVIVAGGGDGTISSVVNIIAHKNITLGILPLGTRNHLAKDLNIPLDLDEAIDAICSGKTIAMDLGAVNGRFFVNNCSIGVYPKTVYIRDKLRPYVGKWFAMIIAIFLMLVKSPWFPVRLEWNDNNMRLLVPLLLIANNAYSTTWPDLGRRPILNSGTLWVTLVRKVGTLQRSRLVASILLGRVHHLEEVEVIQTINLTVRSYRRKIAVGIDAERMKQHTPLVFTSHPQALKVRVPTDVARTTST
jgi:diacylglycerol kinase family enzyme